MKVVVQQRERAMFLRRDEQWTALRTEAAEFKTVVEAIMFCIQCRTRDIKLVGRNDAGDEVHLYPFGGDPVIKAGRKRLRKEIRESRRLKAERRMIQARIDMLLAQSKETKKQFPFPRKPTL